VEPREFKQFMEQCTRLSGRQRIELADVLNGMRAARAPLACPRCRALRMHRDGHADGLQRYRCRDCSCSFNALSGTALARLRHRSKWLPYLDCMLQSATVRRAAALVGIHKNTSFRWRHRFLSAGAGRSTATGSARRKCC
jgi:transposase-like protein